MVENETRQMFVEAATRLFAAHATRKVINDFEAGAWPTELWSRVEAIGLPLIMVSVDVGGAGGSIGDLAAILREAGRHAVPLPLAETGLGAMIVAGAGLTPPAGPLTLVIANPVSSVRINCSKVFGHARRVPFASVARNLIVISSDNGHATVAIVPREASKIEPKRGQTGEPYDNVAFEGAQTSAIAPTSVTPERARELAALARVNQMSGAADRVLAITLQYAKERIQFGRPISAFQAIQHMLAELSTHVAAIGASARAAALHAEAGPGSFGIMAAKSQAGTSAHRICAIAHQSMGAMGFTREHVLHQYTRRLWVWRRDYGSEAHWSGELGRRIAEGGPDAFWPSLTAN